MDEKYRQYKKSKAYRMHLFMNVILFVLFITIVLCAYIFYTELHDNPQNDSSYSFEIINNEVILYNSGEQISKYKCYSNCDVYKEGNKYYFSNGRILLQDEDNFYLYDLINNSKLSSDYKNVDFILDKEDNIRLFKVTDGNKYGIISLTGTIQVDLIYDQLGNYNNYNILTNYNFETNNITALKGNLWGVISMSNGGRGNIDFQYKDIQLSTYGLLAVKEDNLWCLVNEANIKVISTNYEAMYIYEDFLVVVQDNEVFIIDHQGTIITNKIAIYLPVDPWLFKEPNNGLYTEIEDGNLYLYIGLIEEDEYTQMKFIYNKETNEILSI